jgi:acetyltransferase
MNGYIAQRMIERTRIAHWLQQQHQLAPHLAAWEALLAQVGEMVAAIPEIDALDLQPLWLSEAGINLGQVRLRLKKSTGIGNHTAIAPYPRHLQRTLSLRADSTQPCELRPIHPGDAHALQQFVRALSPQARYMRFISALSELTPRMLVRYTQIDYDREMALVAVLPPKSGRDTQIIGVVRYLLNNDRTSCEYAIAIADDWQHQGLGTALMNAIIDCARRKGLARIEGYILANNTPMLGLLRKLNFQIEVDADDPTMRFVFLTLQQISIPMTAG